MQNLVKPQEKCYNLKELFEIVENIDILSIEFLTKEHSVHFCGYHKNTNIHTEYTICVHALAHKCKQFAFEKGFSYIGNNKIINIHSSDNKIIAITNDNVENWFDIEIDIIACNWILENSK